MILAVASCTNQSKDTCQPDDVDGVVGGSVTFDLTVDDGGFSPAILTAQNLTRVTLTVHNAGAKPHNFRIDCMPTPNDLGCPMTSCFPFAASLPIIESGTSATVRFTTPNPEGIYYYHSDVPGDADEPCSAGARGCGQFEIE